MAGRPPRLLLRVRQCCPAFPGRAPDRRACLHSRARARVLPAASHVLARVSPPRVTPRSGTFGPSKRAKQTLTRDFNRNDTMLLKIYNEVISVNKFGTVGVFRPKRVIKADTRTNRAIRT